MELVIVTGMSGAGKSCAIDTLEDIGFFCVDNMTPKLIPTFIKLLNDSEEQREKVAFVVDIRLGDSFSNLFNALEELRMMDVNYKILFIDADNDVLMRRYQETRRKHPLSNEKTKELQEVIIQEREILKKAKDIADFVVDTSFVNTAKLKERIAKLFLDDVLNTMKINVISFGFKYGTPKDSDLVFDVRCLPNPFYVPELKQHTGLEPEVRDYVMQFEQAKELAPKLLDLINYLVPLYRAEGKSQLTISVGCTGGKHRSVVFAELVQQSIKDKGYNVSSYHRDINR
jgi:UPF0042 nucleotide-binding protein